MSYHNINTGALYKNDKRGNENAPDYTGAIYNERGKKRRVAAWLSRSKSGIQYMSLKIENFRDRIQQPKDYPDAGKPQPSGEPQEVNFIPF